LSVATVAAKNSPVCLNVKVSCVRYRLIGTHIERSGL